jgi:putative addiction module killer protein
MVPIVRTAKEYLDVDNHSPFREWLTELDTQARVKVAVAIKRVEQGNDGSIKSVGNGICEIRIDWGPGYRIYFGFDGATLVILLAGGTKRRQDRDIAAARTYWSDYKQRKQRN